MKPPKPSRYPRLWKIRNHWYQLLKMRRLKDDDAGGADWENKVMLVSLNQSDYEFLASMFHEWLHCVAFEYDIKALQDLRIGHPIINKLEYALADLFIQHFKFKKAP